MCIRDRYLQEYRALGDTDEEASSNAYARVVDDFVLGANEERVMDFIGEMKPSQREAIREEWFKLLRHAASNEESVRDA